MLRLNASVPSLTASQLEILNRFWKESARDILNATTLATCGHPGGSLSSLHFLLVLYGLANVHKDNFQSAERDRIYISHGHISPGVYATLARYDFFNAEEMVLHFRRMGARYAGHVESYVPGVEWSSGNLGQGLSAGCGAALGAKIKESHWKTIVCMGDGEQQKGQISEARRIAVKFQLSDLIGIIDLNRYQIGGATQDIMPQNIAENYASDGWNVIHLEKGNDFSAVYQALRKAWNKEVPNPNRPTVILAHTVMGYGFSFMSDICDFHGKSCTMEEHDKAFQELGLPNTLKTLQDQRKTLPWKSQGIEHFKAPQVNVDRGEPIVYSVNTLTDNRSAYGTALADLAKKNNFDPSKNKIVGISCDLEGSVKMGDFKKVDPKAFFECGIQEHHSAVMSGCLSKQGCQVFFSTFGVFGVDEVYNQQRLNAFNHSNLKTVCTHLGLSVGEDGPTHQSIDYIGLLRNAFGYSIFLPADPNQTDHIIRYVAGEYGNFFVGMGRAKTPVIANASGEAFFGKTYQFIPGKADVLTQGSNATIVAYGPLLDYAMTVAKKLSKEGISIRVLNMASIVPFDRQAILAAAQETGAILSVEDHFVGTGIAPMIDQILVEEQISIPVKHLGVQGFCSSGTPQELYQDQGMGLDDIEKQVKTLIAKKAAL